MAIQLLFYSAHVAPPNELLDGAIVVVDERACMVVVTIPAPQVAIVENYANAAVVEDPPRPIAIVTEVDPHLAVVIEVDKPIAIIQAPEIPVAKVTENVDGAEVIDNTGGVVIKT